MLQLGYNEIARVSFLASRCAGRGVGEATGRMNVPSDVRAGSAPGWRRGGGTGRGALAAAPPGVALHRFPLACPVGPQRLEMVEGPTGESQLQSFSPGRGTRERDWERKREERSG